MSDLYAMRRANGDWFALENHGRLRVPLFHSSHDAMMGRLHNFGMLLFAPVVLDAQTLAEIAPAAAASHVDFCLVKNSFENLRQGSSLEQAQVALLIKNGDDQQSSTRGERTLPDNLTGGDRTRSVQIKQS